MPPRKKTTKDDTAPVPARSSSRIKAAASTQQVDASTSATPAPAPVTPSKGKAKRARADTANQDDSPTSKPVSKKAKKAQADDDDAVSTTSKDDAADVDEPKKMVHKCVISECACSVLTQTSTYRSQSSNEEQRRWIPIPIVLVGLVHYIWWAWPLLLTRVSTATHQVYTSAHGVWDAMLNQTDLSGNQNKNK